MRILMITYAYPPLNRTASSRIYSWAKYWSKAGHDITVLTTKKSYADGALNYTPKSIDANIIELNYNRITSSDENVRAINGGKTDKGFRSDLFRKLSFAREKFLPMKLFYRIGIISPGLKQAKALYANHAFDLVVSTFDPFACHIIAGLLKIKKKFFWLADYRDLLSGNNFQVDSHAIRCLERFTEKLFLKRADLISTVSDPLKRKLEILHSKPVVTIENGFDPEEFEKSNGRFFPADDIIRIVHTGTFYPVKQDPTALFRAVQELKKDNEQDLKKMRIEFFGNRCDQISNIAKEYDVAEYVTIHGLVERERSQRIQKEADALLFMDWTDRQQPGIITSKIFEYIFSHTPIFCIGTQFGTVSNDLIEKTGTGLLLGRSVPKIKKAIKKLLTLEGLDVVPNEEVINRFHKKRLAHRLLDEISSRIELRSIYHENNKSRINYG